MTNMHPHSFADLFEACNPGEAHIEYVNPPIPDRNFDYAASLYDGEPCVGYGRTRELAAIDAFESGALYQLLRIWDE